MRADCPRLCCHDGFCPWFQLTAINIGGMSFRSRDYQELHNMLIWKSNHTARREPNSWAYEDGKRAYKDQQRQRGIPAMIVQADLDNLFRPVHAYTLIIALQPRIMKLVKMFYFDSSLHKWILIAVGCRHERGVLIMPLSYRHSAYTLFNLLCGIIV